MHIRGVFPRFKNFEELSQKINVIPLGISDPVINNNLQSEFIIEKIMFLALVVLFSRYGIF